jgi:hypothetical protein
MLADGSVDYRTAAAQTADMGDINSTLKFLALAEQDKQRKAELQAGAGFNAAIGSMFGGGGGQPAARPSAVGVPSLRELGPQPGPVASAPKAWGDDEGVNAGLYDKPATPGARPPMQVASDGVSAPRAPVAQSAPAAADGMPGPQHLPILLKAMSDQHLPSGQKETAKLLATNILGQMKPNERVQYLRELQGNKDLLQIEMDLKRAGKTDVTVDNKGETELSKGLNKGLAERINDIAKEGDVARNDLAMVGQLRDLGAAVKTGGPAALQGWLANWGIKVGDNVGAVEAYSSIVDKLTPAQRVPGSGASSDLDVKMFKNSLPKLINTPEGNEIIQNTLAGVAQYKLERAAIADQVQAGEISAKDGLKKMRDLANPYENFKAFAKNGFRADAGDPSSTGPNFSDRFNAARPGNQDAAKQVAFTKVEIDQSLANARAAIAKNPAAREAVIKKLIDNGLPADGL